MNPASAQAQPLPVIFRRSFTLNREPFALLPTVAGAGGPDHCLAVMKDGSVASLPHTYATNELSEPACPVREPAVAALLTRVEQTLNRTLKTVYTVTHKHHNARRLSSASLT